MKFVLVAAAKDIRRRMADPAALSIWIGLPLLLGGLLSFISSGGGETPPRARVLFVDQDNTALSALFPTVARRGNTPIDLEEVTLDEGRRRIGAGEATALLVIPAGFQNAVVGTGSARLQLVTNPAERVLPAMVRQMLDVVVEGAFYGRQLFSEPLGRIASAPPSGPAPDADVAAIAVEVNQRLTELQGVLLPPVLTLSVKTGTGAQPLNFGQLFLPGMLFMAFLFIAQGMSVDVWDEKQEGTLRRLLTTPQSAGRLLAGKLVAGIVVASVVAFAGLLGAVALFDLAWSRVPLALVWCAYVCGALLAMLTLLHLVARSQRGSEMLAGVVTFPLMMLGGSFFPFEAMPAWMVSVGRWTPNGLGVTRLKELLYGDVSMPSLALAALGIGLPALLCYLVSWRRLRSFANA
ncbi:MAG: ABC transporter permease [Vicinamibacterales bacterium]